MSIGLLLAGCVTIEKSNAMDIERLLSASGFRMKLADTPAKEANAKAMIQRKVVPHIKDGTIYYTYADAEFCDCVYFGSEKNYQALKENIFKRNTAEENEDASMNWDAWGEIGPY